MFFKASKALLPAGLILGLLLPDIAAFIRPALPLVVFLLLILAMIRIPWHQVISLLRHPVFPALCIVWNLFLVPLIVAIVWKWVGWDKSLGYALTIASAAPALMSGPSFALLVGLNAALALVVTVGTLVFVPFSLPLLTYLVTQEAIVPSAQGLFVRSLVTVFGALAIAGFLRNALGADRLRRHAKTIDAASIIILIVFAIGVVDGLSKQFATDPGQVAQYIFVAVLVNLLVQFASAIAFRSQGYRDALTLSLITGSRNTALLLAIVPPPIDPAITLFVGAAQFPLYVLPFVLEPLYRRLSRNV
jgi:BASS family bile acid:Na+ symporter